MISILYFAIIYTVDLVIFACLDFHKFVILGLIFTNSKIRELSISMIGSAHNNNFWEIPKFTNMSYSDANAQT